MPFFIRQFQRLPESSRSILLTGIYGLVGGLAAVIFELGINWIYLSTFVLLSHRTLTVFLLGTLAVVVGCSLGGGWLMASVDQGAAGAEFRSSSSLSGRISDSLGCRPFS